MTKTLPLIRPGLTAIAAVLALSSTPVFAQAAPIDGSTPPIIQMTPPTIASPPPVVSEIPAPSPAGPARTVAPPVIAAPETIARPVAEAAPVAREPAAPREAIATRRAAPAPRNADAAAVEQAPAAATSVAVAETIDPALAPIPVGSVAPAVTSAPADSAPAEPVGDPAAMNASDWVLIGGGAASLLLLGGAGLAFARRKRSGTLHITELPTISAPPIAPSFSPAEPTFARTQRVAAGRAANPVATAIADGAGRHEALALLGPSQDNPFLTRGKRLKRARFYDRRERLTAEAERAACHADSFWAKPAADQAQSASRVQREPQRIQLPLSGGIGTLKPGLAKG